MVQLPDSSRWLILPKSSLAGLRVPCSPDAVPTVLDLHAQPGSDLKASMSPPPARLSGPGAQQEHARGAAGAQSMADQLQDA